MKQAKKQKGMQPKQNPRESSNTSSGTRGYQGVNRRGYTDALDHALYVGADGVDLKEFEEAFDLRTDRPR